MEDSGLPQGFQLDEPVAQQEGGSPGLPQGFQLDDEKYGSVGQQALTAIEGVGRGLTGGLSDAAFVGLRKGASALGVPDEYLDLVAPSPEAEKSRRETNPITNTVSEIGGFAGSSISGVGIAPILESAGNLGVKAAGLGAANTFAGKIGASTLNGLIQGALFNSSDELTKKIVGDPDQTAQSVISHIGLGGLFGAGTGLTFGTVHSLWDHFHGEPVTQAIQDFKNATNPEIGTAEGELEKAGLRSRLTQLKQNSAEIAAAASRNDWPLAEGMTSGSKEIQQAEDALLNGPPTIASVSRRAVYQKAHDAVNQSVDLATAGQDALSETQAGGLLKDSLSKKLSAQYEPIKQLYSEIEPYQQAIPVSDKSTASLSRTIGKIIDEENLIKGTPEYNFVQTMSDGIGQVDSLAKLKSFRTALNRSSGPETRYVASKIIDKLDGVEERAIQRFADTMKTGQAKDAILELIDKSNSARSQYAGFRSQLQELGNSLGKKKIYGPQDFIDFVDEMNPQSLARKAFNENNTTFATKFAKNFPEEFSILRSYQRGLIRESATKEGVFQAQRALKNIGSMEPEMKKLIFSPNEMGVFSDAKTYLDSFPKSFNPSGTAHENAFRAFFEHPTGAVIANLRDTAIQGFIKAIGRASQSAQKDAAKLLPILGNAVQSNEANSGAFKHTVEYLSSYLKADNNLQKAADSVFTGSVLELGKTAAELSHIDKKIAKIQENPEEIPAVGGNVGHYLPNHGEALARTAMAAANYVNANRPVNHKANPLDADFPPTQVQKAKFNRMLSIVNNPSTVLSHVKSGSLQPEDLATLKAVYPALYNQMSEKLVSSMTDHLSQGKTIPYHLKRSLSLFFGTPLDSTLSQPAMAAIMMANRPRGSNAQQGGAPQGRPHKATSTSMQKVNQMYSTPAQAREAHRNG